MPADGAHLEYWSAQKKKLEVYSRTIHVMFALSWLTIATAENFHTIFLLGAYVKTMWPS